MQQQEKGEEVSISKKVTRTNDVVAGSVWETRMKMDQVKGGIKVFNAGEAQEEIANNGVKDYSTRRLACNQSDGVTTERRKRKNWKPPEPDKSPIQLRRNLSELVVGGEDEGDEIEVDDKVVDSSKVEAAEEEKKIDQICEVPICSNAVKKPEDVLDCPTIDPILPESSPIEEDDDFYESMPETHNRTQSIVDLVMWRDMSRSAFVFGIGTFLLISSSYTKDLDFSLISAASYLGLLYLAAIFIFKSFICRGIEFDGGDERILIKEEEAIRLIKRFLPYINEILIKLRALFSGDPSTTMKLGVLLFVLARFGGQITIWAMAKLAFFGVFTMPKLCSSYSSQLSRYGNFWVERSRDAWESCTNKKAAIGIIFIFIWNLSSTMARIWAVFMLVVAVKYYQQCVVTTERDDENKEIDAEVGKRGGSDPEGSGCKVHGAGLRYRQSQGTTKLQGGVKEKKKA